MNYSKEEFIKAIKVLPADLSAGASQVSFDLVDRNQNDIYMNGYLLKDISASHISSVWNHLFGGSSAKELTIWQNFANRYLHQGGFLYPLEGMIVNRLTEKFAERGHNQLFFAIKPSKKVLYINFDHENNRLTFKEEIVYTALKDSNEKCSFEAKKRDRYLFKGVLLHQLELERGDEPVFRHFIQKVDVDSRLTQSKYALYRCEKKQLQSKCNVYLESLHLKFDKRDGLANTYKETATDSLVRKPAVRNKKKRAIKTERQLIAGQGHMGLTHCAEVESRLLLRPLDDTVTTTYALASLNLAGASFPLLPYLAHQPAGFFPAENRHKKLSRATANKRSNLDCIDEVPGAEGTCLKRSA